MQLAEDEVHLWRIATDRPCELPNLRELLAVDERAKAHRFRFDRDRRRSIVRRAALRQIIGRYLDVSPAELSFCYGPQGKPLLAAPFCEAGLEFNLSFSGETALCAVARQPLGVDLERYRMIEDAGLVAKHFFTPAEISLQNGADDANRVFLRHWTRKEALIKATGSGLSVALSSFDVSWLPDGAPRQVTLADADGRPTTWYLRDLAPAPDELAALATALPDAKIRWHGYSASV
ncbi:MAG TPA: 4'-phosphopantetheinyl transferase superfamily protein [Pirellulales bacterium]|jgi:4'-phosphopantetheinyl transferase|nr:4'-phosphopantetheinyl transferase superfamily protein [Pirellulales bacterium]